MQTIAEAVGVSRMTVSLALKGKPGRVSEINRRKIIQKAKELGYRLDPKISSLATYLAERRRLPGIREEIPFLIITDDIDHYLPRLIHFYHYAKDYAEYHGYRLVRYHLGPGGYTQAQLERIFDNRGVQGVFLAPLQNLEIKFQPTWEKYAWIAFGDSWRQQRIHRIDTDFRHALLAGYKQLHRYGYQKIGLAAGEVTDRNLNYALSTAATTYYRSLSPARRVPLLLRDEVGDPNKYSRLVARWIERHQIDAVISPPHLYTAFQQIPLVKKNKIGFAAHLLSPDNKENLAGMQRSRESLGKTSVELLLSQITHGVRGITKTPVRTLIEGYWVDGPTVRKKRGKFPLPESLL